MSELKQAVLKAVDDELECPGTMPDEMWELMQGDRDATEEGIRITVRLTKQGIRERIKELAAWNTRPALSEAGVLAVLWRHVPEPRVSNKALQAAAAEIACMGTGGVDVGQVRAVFEENENLIGDANGLLLLSKAFRDGDEGVQAAERLLNNPPEPTRLEALLGELGRDCNACKQKDCALEIVHYVIEVAVKTEDGLRRDVASGVNKMIRQALGRYPASASGEDGDDTETVFRMS